MPGPPPKPTRLKLVTGNPGKRALNKAEARVAAGIPEPPPELNDDARREWDHVSVRLNACGLLTVIDRAVLAAYCQAYGRWVQAERVLSDSAADYPRTYGLIVETVNGNPILNPALGAANKAMADMVRYALELGMSPASRSRVQVNLEKRSEDAERFF